MFFVWRGFGWAVPVIAVASFVLVLIMAQSALGDDYTGQKEWMSFLAVAVGAGLIAALGYFLNYKKRKIFVDQETGKIEKSDSHTLFFIPIEFWAVIIPVLFIWMQSVSAENDAKYRAYLETPAVGDLYSVDYTKIFEGADDEFKYGVAKVTSLTADTVDVILADVSYNKKSGVRKDISKEKPSKDGYFSNETAVFTRVELSDYLESGAIYSISRD